MNGTHTPEPPATAELQHFDAPEEVDAEVTGRQPDLGEIEAQDAEALRGITFPVTWRGYDVHAVDDFVESVEAWIDRFQQAHSPTEAVRAALDRVGEQTAAILREAERSAEETTRASRARADDRLQRAERESEALWAAAQARVRGLDDDIERLWEERQRLIDATRELADRLRATAVAAEARFPPDDESAITIRRNGTSPATTAGTAEPTEPDATVEADVLAEDDPDATVEADALAEDDPGATVDPDATVEADALIDDDAAGDEEDRSSPPDPA